MIKRYPTLYSIDTTGKIRTWTQEQDGAMYRTVSGVMNSDNLVTSQWTVAQGKNTGKKNETTDEEQATAEIDAKFKKQLKTGYFKDIKDVNKFQYVEPMLAKNYKDYADDIDFNKESWAMQCKYNGNRCIATKNGLHTRKGEKYISVPHIDESLINFFEKHPNAVLDGELFNYDLRQTLNELSTLVRKTVNITPEVLKKSKEIVKFYVYDGYGWDDTNESTPYSERKEWIDKNIVGKYKYIEEVKSYPINDVKEFNRVYNLFVDDNEEGGILRKTDEGYQHKRSKFLLKIKSEMDDEAVILDIIEGEGNWSGTGKIISLKWKDKVFRATFKGTYAQAVDFLINKKQYIGKTVTFLYNDLTGLKIPNYARVDINNCFKTDK